MAQVFRSRAAVRFAHCDSAGLIFYPRALELVNGVVEDWFADGLGYSFSTMHLRDGLGIPTVRLETVFSSAAVLGDMLEFELTVAALGRSSADLAIVANANGAERFRTQLRVVFTRLAERKSVPIPDSLRPAMQAYLRAS